MLISSSKSLLNTREKLFKNSKNLLILRDINKFISKKYFFKKLPLFGNEISVKDQKTDERELYDYQEFKNKIIEYSLKVDFKTEKDKVILPKNYDIQFPFVLYESPGRPVFFIFICFCLGMGLTFMYYCIKHKLYSNKYHPSYTPKYITIQVGSILLLLFSLKHMGRIVKKITILNINNNPTQKNLEIKLFYGKILKQNISDIYFDKPLLLKLKDLPLFLFKIKEKQHYLTLKNSNIHDRALFMNIIRGNDLYKK